MAAATVFYAGFFKEKTDAKIIFLDVGQGDSILIILPGDQQIVIDGGPSVKILDKIGKYLPFYDKKLELLVLTHPHADHLRGLNHLLKNYEIKNIWLTGAFYESSIYKEFIRLLNEEGAKLYLAKEGDKIKWRGETILRVLTPGKIVLGKDFRKIHQSMLVSELEIGGVKFALMGDTENKLEQELVSKNLLGDVDVLKVGHHGSKTSTSQELLNTTKPEVAVIQVGKNSYGHPTDLVLDRLKKAGAVVLRTDELGDIVWSFKVR